MKIPALGILFGILAALFIGNVRAHDKWDNSKTIGCIGFLCYQEGGTRKCYQHSPRP